MSLLFKPARNSDDELDILSECIIHIEKNRRELADILEICRSLKYIKLSISQDILTSTRLAGDLYSLRILKQDLNNDFYKILDGETDPNRFMKTKSARKNIDDI